MPPWLTPREAAVMTLDRVIDMWPDVPPENRLAVIVEFRNGIRDGVCR